MGLAGRLSAMWELTGIAFVAVIFTYTTAASFWNRQFSYRFGPTILRSERPIEYWAMTLLFTGVTCLLWLIFVLIATGNLKKWEG
jgi:hypothetical protein